MLMMMDHTGNFGANLAGLNTPGLDVASNDHAIGLLVDAVSHSPYWKDTAIFIVEDDSLPDRIMWRRIGHRLMSSRLTPSGTRSVRLQYGEHGPDHHGFARRRPFGA
jgi:hypothetical protein